MLAMLSYSQKGISSGIQTIGGTIAFHNGAMMHICCKFMKVLSTEFL